MSEHDESFVLFGEGNWQEKDESDRCGRSLIMKILQSAISHKFNRQEQQKLQRDLERNSRYNISQILHGLTSRRIRLISMSS